MQHQPIAAKMLCRAAILPQIAMFAITDNRMAKMGKMASQLMFTSGFRFQFHQAIAGRGVTSGRHRHLYRRQAAVMGDRRLRVFIFASELIGDFIQLLNQRVIKHRFVVQPAASDRMVAFLHLMLLELLRQQSSRFAR